MSPTSFFASFRIRLLLLAVFLVIPAFGLACWAYMQQSRTEAKRVLEGVAALSRLAAASQDTYVRNGRQLLVTLTQFDFLVLATNRVFCEVHFGNLLKLTPDYLDFGLVEKDGSLFCNAMTSNVPPNLFDLSYFRRTMDQNRFTIGRFQEEKRSNEYALTFGYPVSSQDKVERTVFSSLRLSLLSEALARIPIPSGGVAMTIDRDGRVLAHFPEPEKWVGTNSMDSELLQHARREEAGAFETAGLDGRQRLFAVSPIAHGSDAPLLVIVGIPLEDSLAFVRSTLVHNLMIFGAAVVLILVAARVYVGRLFLNPVAAMSQAAQRMTSGDLTARTGISAGQGELGELCHSFDVMAETLQKREAEISRMNAELEQRVKERTARLEESNQELEAFSFSVSHDLRAPLRHIGSFAQLLQQRAVQQLDDQGKRHLKIICDATSKMGALIDDLLAFSRLGRVEMRRTPVDINKLVQEILPEVEALHTGRPRIEWQIGPLPSVHGDPALLRQVWINLLSNAVKYSSVRETACVEVSARESGREWVFAVRDNGVGFDMAYAHKLFGVFQRLHTEKEFEGTGVGLANVRRIVSRHGGRTWAESVLNEGATFYFSISMES